jgi:hypothetical protein
MRKEFILSNRGVFALGYIQNQSSYLTSLSSLIGTNVDEADLEENIQQAYLNEAEINYYYDANGNLQSGAFDEEKTSRYAVYTGYNIPKSGSSTSNDKVYALFQKDRYGKWNGVKFYTEYKMKNILNAYRFGSISFRNFSEANTFITMLENKLLPGETWKFKSADVQDYRPKTAYDILQSYLQYVFEKLLEDFENASSKNYKKILISSNSKHALFNTGLLNKFAQDIYLVGDVFFNNNRITSFSNPEIAPSKVDLIRTYGFTNSELTPFPGVVEFFENLDDIIYDPEIEIDLSADRLSHIIEDGAKRNRFAEKYKILYDKGDLPSITSTLETAIDNARKIAKRNYKYVVPQYRSSRYSEEGKIQFLMPIYLDRQYGERPDFALVLNIEDLPDGTKLYTPETILELSWAYNNARVICKPEDTWLNPQAIDSSPEEEKTIYENLDDNIE